jgi:hypothetical protein
MKMNSQRNPAVRAAGTGFRVNTQVRGGELCSVSIAPGLATFYQEDCKQLCYTTNYCLIHPFTDTYSLPFTDEEKIKFINNSEGCIIFWCEPKPKRH